jgi:hypothetical protein
MCIDSLGRALLLIQRCGRVDREFGAIGGHRAGTWRLVGRIDGRWNTGSQWVTSPKQAQKGGCWRGHELGVLLWR